jgi:hypothetical protein
MGLPTGGGFDPGVEVGGIVLPENAQLEFVGRRGCIANMNAGAIDKMVAPDACLQKGTGKSAADAAGVVHEMWFAQVVH